MEKFRIVRVRTNAQMKKLKEIDRIIFPEDAAVEVEAAVWWLVMCGAEAVGFAGLAIHPTYGFLRRCGIRRGFRSKGLHKRLIRVRLRYMKRTKHDDRPAITYTTYVNRRSANNLLACGFRLYEPQSNYGTKNALYLMYRF